MDTRSNKVYSVTALFDTPDEIMSAATKVRDAGYIKFDVHTPYPVHGMDHAMGLSQTKVPFITLIFGLLGLTIAFCLQTGVMAWDYKLNVGGKPFFSLPAFVPIMFELTVLIGCLATVGFMLAVFNKLPNNNSPLHDTEFMRAVMCDKFGVTIESADEKFSEAGAKKFLESIGGKGIETIYYKDSE